ncbi:MAG TPA: hypothetical protein VFK42_18490 [Acidimicrobiales bacterium]|jgi:hypothetical protein|nr:hypothetical protein [Acidimicrobiales bacterium]
MRVPTRWLAAATLTAGALAGPLAITASATPGSTPASSSCLGAITDYLAHFDVVTGEPTHGQVGDLLSADATTEPGVVGQFNRVVAGFHGTVTDCVPE